MPLGMPRATASRDQDQEGMQMTLKEGLSILIQKLSVGQQNRPGDEQGIFIITLSWAFHRISPFDTGQRQYRDLICYPSTMVNISPAYRYNPRGIKCIESVEYRLNALLLSPYSDIHYRPTLIKTSNSLNDSRHRVPQDLSITEHVLKYCAEFQCQLEEDDEPGIRFTLSPSQMAAPSDSDDIFAALPCVWGTAADIPIKLSADRCDYIMRIVILEDIVVE
ncbi:hypothetical protein KSP40_PGU001754 [Platanthera guangdongensis]|uniref:Uncharacterized protein n=1 Tax=Platanthera guangdongensis TaxID=2320717 RepID=A0ABR2LDJ9_9ASPA